MKIVKRKARSRCRHVDGIGWLQRISVAGFIFFLAKGLVWVVAIVWVAY